MKNILVLFLDQFTKEAREKNLIKKRNEFMIRTKSRREERSGEGVNSSYCETPKGVKLRRKNAKRKSQREQRM